MFQKGGLKSLCMAHVAEFRQAPVGILRRQRKKMCLLWKRCFDVNASDPFSFLVVTTRWSSKLFVMNFPQHLPWGKILKYFYVNQPAHGKNPLAARHGTVWKLECHYFFLCSAWGVVAKFDHKFRFLTVYKPISRQLQVKHSLAKFVHWFYFPSQNSLNSLCVWYRGYLTALSVWSEWLSQTITKKTLRNLLLSEIHCENLWKIQLCSSIAQNNFVLYIFSWFPLHFFCSFLFLYFQSLFLVSRLIELKWY